jgi:hypothetical protein
MSYADNKYEEMTMNMLIGIIHIHVIATKIKRWHEEDGSWGDEDTILDV